MKKALFIILTEYRRPLIIAANALLSVASLWISLSFRFDFDQESVLTVQRFFLPAGLLLFFRSVTYAYWDLNRGYWRYASTQDVISIVKAHGVSSALFASSILIMRIDGFPRSVLFLELFLSILFACGSRLVVRVLRERLRGSEAASPADEREVVVIGAGDSGHLVVKVLTSQRRLGMKPVAVFDDSEHLTGISVYGVRVVGPTSLLEEFLESHPHVAGVILAVPSLSERRFQELSGICRSFSIALKRVQSFEDIACLDANSPRNGISIESVLDRDVDVAHESQIGEALCGKSIMITGGGGSIGSELARQVSKFRPRKLILFDSSEYNLFRIGVELRERSDGPELALCLGSVVNEQRLASVFAEHQPRFVFHTAAYKHVPLLEDNAYEAFMNNVVGTRNVLRTARISGAEKFVLISTDKAVDPSSVMGCTKRIGEFLTHACCDGGNGLNAAVVRFGNVINSAGSVIPRFKEQILSGGPITVTHPDMERYFMSIREAVRLVLTAGTLGGMGDIFILNMGRPIRIVDVAQKMLALYGRRDIPIIFTGMRPGEKLTECLTDESEMCKPTRFSKVGKVTVLRAPRSNPFDWVAEMERIVNRLSEQELTAKLRSFATPLGEAQNAAVADARVAAR